MKRIARFAGLWYPDDPQELSEIASVSPKGGADYRFSVLPHAGLYYSGELIASFFANLAPDINRIIILAPSHYHCLKPGRLYTADFTESGTPLGTIPTIPLDTPYSFVDDQAVADEHAVEMFLPFIAARGGASVSFGLINQVSTVEEVRMFSSSLLPLVDTRTAVIASSDFTHYGRRFGYMPFGRRAVEKVVQNDINCAHLLANGDIEGIISHYADGTVCGMAPAMIVSELARQAGLSGHVDGHSTSLDKGRSDDDDFVSYVTIFWG